MGKSPPDSLHAFSIWSASKPAHFLVACWMQPHYYFFLSCSGVQVCQACVHVEQGLLCWITGGYFVEILGGKDRCTLALTPLPSLATLFFIKLPGLQRSLGRACQTVSRTSKPFCQIHFVLLSHLLSLLGFNIFFLILPTNLTQTPETQMKYTSNASVVTKKKNYPLTSGRW